MDNVYLRLTREFNAGRLRAVICSGQAIVLHRLAVASKDGDWIVRAERRELMRTNEARLGAFQRAARSWAGAWPALDRELRLLPLAEAHRRIMQRAEGVLPYAAAEV